MVTAEQPQPLTPDDLDRVAKQMREASSPSEPGEGRGENVTEEEW
jgi:hypothetical protein